MMLSLTLGDALKYPDPRIHKATEVQIAYDTHRRFTSCNLDGRYEIDGRDLSVDSGFDF